MNLFPGMFVIDNDEIVYRVMVVKTVNDYSEAVLEVQGSQSHDTMLYTIFYRSNYAWVDRESPDFKLVEEVDYYPHSV